MRNENFYKIVIVLLLLLNGGTLTYLMVNQNKEQHGPGHMPPHRGNPVDRMMSERLSLTAEQEEKFRGLKDEHHGQMMDIQKEEQQLHKDLFVLLKANNVDTVAKAALMERLKENDMRKEDVTFEHFRKLRVILTAEQQPKFDDLMEEISSHILAPHGGKGGPPPPPPGR